MHVQIQSVIYAIIIDRHILCIMPPQNPLIHQDPDPGCGDLDLKIFSKHAHVDTKSVTFIELDIIYHSLTSLS